MKTKLSVALAAAACALALSVGAAKASVVYDVDLSAGIRGSVTGTITTDGTIGTLNSGNITGWDLTLNEGSDTFVLQPGVGNDVTILGTQTSATATGLFFNFSGTGIVGLTFTSAASPSNVFLCFGLAGTCLAGIGDGIVFGGGAFSGFQIHTESGLVEIAQATPLPAALPLFASGLGALGLLGWRRKRKAQAVA
jgi:hypothetical protein